MTKFVEKSQWRQIFGYGGSTYKEPPEISRCRETELYLQTCIYIETLLDLMKIHRGVHV
jgi:hypothetical protein